MTERPRVVFTSTVVTGDAQGAEIDEDTELPVQTAYGRSKQEGERRLRNSGLDVVIIRPCHIYGAGGWYAEEFVKRLRQPGRFAVIGSGDNWWDMVRVEDVATAFVRRGRGGAGRLPLPRRRRRADPLLRLPRAHGRGAGRRPAAARPGWLARLGGGADPVIAVTRSARNSNAKIKRELGWSPRYPTAAQGVPDAVANLAA